MGPDNDIPVVLIVDDAPEIGESLAELFSTEGYHAVAVDSGQKALALLEENEVEPCLVLVDYRMPVMDGVAFLRRLRAKKPEVPCAMMTAAQSAHIPGLCEFPSLPIIKKPFSIEDVLGFVKQYC